MQGIFRACTFYVTATAVLTVQFFGMFAGFWLHLRGFADYTSPLRAASPRFVEELYVFLNYPAVALINDRIYCFLSFFMQP